MSTQRKKRIYTSILREFETDVRNKKYTRCPLGTIIASDSCLQCKHCIEIIRYNEKTDKHFINRGIVECAYNPSQNLQK